MLSLVCLQNHERCMTTAEKTARLHQPAKQLQDVCVRVSVLQLYALHLLPGLITLLHKVDEQAERSCDETHICQNMLSILQLEMPG